MIQLFGMASLGRNWKKTKKKELLIWTELIHLNLLKKIN